MIKRVFLFFFNTEKKITVATPELDVIIGRKKSQDIENPRS